jgi:hypothetical protein
VTQIVRLVRNTASLRKEGMQAMLKEYFAGELKPVVRRELNRLNTSVNKKVLASLNTTLQNFNADSLLTAEEKKAMVDMTTDEIIERLKRSALGEKLLTGLGDKAQAVFDELGKRYEIVGKKATESFRKHSRKWATFFALLLALALNIDSIHIANTYIKNESARQAVIAQNEAFIEDYNTLAKTLEEEQGQETFTREELEQAFQDSREQLALVQGAGFPIGWSYFPHSYFEGKDGSSLDYQQRNTAPGWITWGLGVLLTGALAGLGGPFWYDMVARISRTVQSTRAAADKPEG